MDRQTFYPRRWTERLFDDHDRRHAYGGETGAAFDDWQESFREELRELLGHPTIEAAGVPDLAPKRVGTTRAYDHTHEKWVVRTEPGIRVPFYLLLPDDADPPYPVVVAVHGHGETGKELYVGRFETEEQRLKIVDGDRDIAVQAVERGYAAIAPDMRGFGELAPSDREWEGESACRTMQLHAQLFGRSLIGDRVWDVTRLLDFAAEADRLDADRVAVTGNSGGGTVTLFAAAVEERIDVAVPSAYFCTFADSIAAMCHCACNYLPGVLGLGEMYDVAGLVAPRPFLAVAGAEDPIFPIEGTREAFDRLQSVYDGAGAPDRCALHVGAGGHRYYRDGVWPFVEEWL